MTQFKDKGGAQESVRAGLLTYPVLQAADILLYDADRVPVGDDQRQHLELTRDLANRFNHRYGATFTVPEAAIPRVGARVMDLQEPSRKMSKSVESPLGTIYIIDDPTDIERKVKRAVTDSGTDIVYDPVGKPGVSNLLELLGAATGRSPQDAADGYSSYGSLKSDVAAALIELLRPVRERHAKLVADPGAVESILDIGSAKAELVASATYTRASEAIGLLPRKGISPV
jgi:tryptophanyl-tRNA synthetase